MNTSPDPPSPDVEAAVRRALAEDLTPFGDLSAALVPADTRTAGAIMARHTGVLAGTACAAEVFRQVDPSVDVEWIMAEGDRLEPGSVIATVGGPLAPILTAERTALNFLSHLSGIASLVARWVDAAAGGAVIWDTRKTTPGLRTLEKAAVRAGGGRNHRANLSDRVMLKDNHLLGTDIASAVARSRELWPDRIVHVECDTLEQVSEALSAGADALLLDNMVPDVVREAVGIAHSFGEAGGDMPLLEASGGITLETVADYAATGVDCVSSGSLTQAAPALDIGLDLDRVGP
ncbi:MAG: carboxylating nicotinate-nucleotide diphosphorylase [Actinobacteria bacterium]|nr:carboxylating nicotinate-nucleotide diphosphorylase [Actinomycetota bacterium]